MCRWDSQLSTKKKFTFHKSQPYFAIRIILDVYMYNFKYKHMK